MIARGKNINVTLIFSLERYAEVADAYIRGLERLVEAGGDPTRVASVANAKLAYQRYKEIFSGARWEALAAKGGSPQRCLWASTSTKNPEYRDVMYVEELIGPETVNTMPRETTEAVQDHAKIEDTLDRDVEGARKVLEDLKAAGVDYDDVVAVLEREGVEKFAKSFKDLFSDVEDKRDRLVAA